MVSEKSKRRHDEDERSEAGSGADGPVVVRKPL
jgi:hypothetical protein